MLYQSVSLTTLFLGKCKLEHCRPYKAACHPARCDIINDIKLFPTVYRRRYCRNFLTLSTKASASESPLTNNLLLFLDQPKRKKSFSWSNLHLKMCRTQGWVRVLFSSQAALLSNKPLCPVVGFGLTQIVQQSLSV